MVLQKARPFFLLKLRRRMLSLWDPSNKTVHHSFARACTAAGAAFTGMMPQSLSACSRLSTSSSLCAAERLTLSLHVPNEISSFDCIKSRLSVAWLPYIRMPKATHQDHLQNVQKVGLTGEGAAMFATRVDDVKCRQPDTVPWGA